MTYSLADLLGKRDFEEPPEVVTIKNYVRDKYRVEVGVMVQPNQIIINTPGAALAGSLRMDLHRLKGILETERRLVIRIV